MYPEQVLDTTFIGIIILALLIIIILTVILYIRLRSGFMKGYQSFNKYEELPQKYLTVVKCSNGDYIIEKEFQEGDFVGKIVGECPKCGNKLLIDAIYAQYVLRKR